MMTSTVSSIVLNQSETTSPVTLPTFDQSASLSGLHQSTTAATQSFRQSTFTTMNFNQSETMSTNFNQSETVSLNFSQSATMSMNFSQSATNYVTECVILGVNVTIPWDNPYSIVSRETEIMFETFKSKIAIPALYVIGAPTNVINLVVFRQQGLRERINFCLFLLALVDFLFITFLIVEYGERLYEHPDRFGPVSRYLVNYNVIGLYGLGSASAFLTAVISTEKCICVLFPLKAHSCMPLKAFAMWVVGGVILLTGLRFLGTAQYAAACYYEVANDRTSNTLGASQFRADHLDLIKYLDGVFYGVVISIGCPIVVLIATIITVIKLRQSVKWRMKSIYNSSTSTTSTTNTTTTTTSSASSKEAGVTKMLICLSLEFVILSLPFILLRLSSIVLPDAQPSGVNSNIVYLFIDLVELCTCISSSVNFFVYYATGSRFRATLKELCGRGRKKKMIARASMYNRSTRVSGASKTAV